MGKSTVKQNGFALSIARRRLQRHEVVKLFTTVTKTIDGLARFYTDLVKKYRLQRQEVRFSLYYLALKQPQFFPAPNQNHWYHFWLALNAPITSKNRIQNNNISAITISRLNKITNTAAKAEVSSGKFSNKIKGAGFNETFFNQLVWKKDLFAKANIFEQRNYQQVAHEKTNEQLEKSGKLITKNNLETLDKTLNSRDLKNVMANRHNTSEVVSTKIRRHLASHEQPKEFAEANFYENTSQFGLYHINREKNTRTEHWQTISSNRHKVQDVFHRQGITTHQIKPGSVIQKNQDSFNHKSVSMNNTLEYQSKKTTLARTRISTGILQSNRLFHRNYLTSEIVLNAQKINQGVRMQYIQGEGSDFHYTIGRIKSAAKKQNTAQQFTFTSEPELTYRLMPTQNSPQNPNPSKSQSANTTVVHKPKMLSEPGSMTANNDVRAMADTVYRLIVDRVKREKALRG